MVKVFDPSRRDPTIRVLREFQEWLYNERSKLSEAETYQALQIFLKGKQYESMMKKYSEEGLAPPDVVINSRCDRKRHFFFGGNPAGSAQYFKGFFSPIKNEITLCSNVILNFLELKENLDRELTVAYDYNIRKQDISRDENFVCTQLRACKAQLNNYGEYLTEDLKKNMAAACAKYLLRVNNFILIYNIIMIIFK